MSGKARPTYKEYSSGRWALRLYFRQALADRWRWVLRTLIHQKPKKTVYSAALTTTKDLCTLIIPIYGALNVFVGSIILSTAYYRQPRIIGCNVLAVMALAHGAVKAFTLVVRGRLPFWDCFCLAS